MSQSPRKPRPDPRFSRLAIFFDRWSKSTATGPLIRPSTSARRCWAVVIPEDFAKKIGLKQPANVQLLLDGSDSNTAAIAQGYAEGVVAMYSQQLADSDSNAVGAACRPPSVPDVRVWYNPDLLSGNFIVPGLVVVIVMIIAANLGSLTIAREWENGTMEQLLSTPARPSELALGKLSAYFVVGAVDMLISYPGRRVCFRRAAQRERDAAAGVELRSFCSARWGWESWFRPCSASQLMAYQMGTLISFLPAFLLSGFIYSIGSMPRVIQVVSLFVPARYFMEVARGIFLKGIGVQLLWFNLLLLIGYAALVFYFATRKLRQKVA